MYEFTTESLFLLIVHNFYVKNVLLCCCTKGSLWECSWLSCSLDIWPFLTRDFSSSGSFHVRTSSGSVWEYQEFWHPKFALRFIGHPHCYWSQKERSFTKITRIRLDFSSICTDPSCSCYCSSVAHHAQAIVCCILKTLVPFKCSIYSLLL